MKVGCPSQIGKFFAVALVPLLFGAGCNSSNQASASLPPSTPAAYPSNLQAAPAAPGSVFADVDDYKEKAPPAPKFKPFVLRDGERLADYKVGKGDTLGKIAKTYGTSVSRIQSANGLNGTLILDGKTYKIPTMKSEEQIAAATKSAPSTVASAPSTTPKPPSIPSFGGTATKTPTTPPSTISRTYNPSTSRTYSPPPTEDRPTFTPRTFDYSGPTISSPSRSASSITIPSEDETKGSGAAFPTPTFGSGSSF